MNREIKILLVVVFFTLLTYVGVETFAHSQMHKHVEGNNFAYNGADDDASKKEFWDSVNTIAALEGNAEAGAAGYAMCAGCHMEGAVNMGGVIPPALDHTGSLYGKNYLIALIKDPAMAMNTQHKFADTMMHPMGSIKSMITEDQAIADTVAYLLKNNAEEATPEQAYLEACGRCHENHYAGLTQLGKTPKFKHEKDALAHKIKVLEEQELVKGYMGTLPPDLSMMALSRNHHFMETFIENPQSQLAGTSMPRVGLTKEGTEKVLTYMLSKCDSNAAARDSVGWKVMLFFVIFSVLAYLWKKQVWSKLH